MKFTKVIMAAVVALASGRAYAFHSGGVAECEGCHTMHNSTTGEGTVSKVMGLSGSIGAANPFLLQGTDQSSTCLNCHANTPAGSYHILSKDNQGVKDAIDATKVNFTPGGDFMWLNNEWTYTGYEGQETQAGQRAGHNVVAADFNIVADARKLPPGSGASGELIGGWDGTGFACVSCHDPHGKYRYNSATTGTFVNSGPAIQASGSYSDSAVAKAGYANSISTTVTVGAYRILGGVNYQPKSGAGPKFLNDPPVALAPGKYSGAESGVSGTTGNWANQVQVAYGQGMSEWCKNCHPQMHSNTVEPSGAAKLNGLTIHPAGNSAKFSSAIVANYNGYISTGNFVSAATDNYDSLVPFEVGTANLDTLKGFASQGLTATNNVVTSAYVKNPATAQSNPMCLSCHRAHASGFNSMTRWNNDGEFLTSSSGWKNISFAGAQGQTVTGIAHYNRPASVYGNYQRSLCNKCHNKD